ncbi:MAG: hypothetical protein ACJ8R9_22105 [Steroidobacteraceae bacterium]
MFDHFLAHEEARLERGDLAPITLASHREILDHAWRPYLGHLPLLGIRHSLLALAVTDYDAAHGVLSIIKARVQGIDKDVTKTAEDRRLVLSLRAIAVLGRQLELRQRLLRAGVIQHEHLFFTADGEPIRRLAYPYSRWRRTLQTLAIRYRKPYAARHSSVSWDLMLGRNPLWVAKQHGHSISTMLSIYAAWVEGALEVDVETIRESMSAGAPSSSPPPAEPHSPRMCETGHR